MRPHAACVNPGLYLPVGRAGHKKSTRTLLANEYTWNRDVLVKIEVTNVCNDRGQLARMAKLTKAVLERETLDVVADRGYCTGRDIYRMCCVNWLRWQPDSRRCGAKVLHDSKRPNMADILCVDR